MSSRNDMHSVLGMALGHEWPREGGDAQLIRVLLRMTQDAMSADEEIGTILVKAMKQVVEPRERSTVTMPDNIVTVVHLTESSSDERC